LLCKHHQPVYINTHKLSVNNLIKIFKAQEAEKGKDVLLKSAVLASFHKRPAHFCKKWYICFADVKIGYGMSTA